MTRRISVPMAIFLASMLPLVATAQDAPAPSPSPAAAPEPVASPEPATPAPADEVVVTVNGTPIMASEVDATFNEILERQSRGRAVPEAMLDQLREQWRPRIVDSMIEQKLVDAVIAEAGVTATEEEYQAEMEKSLQAYLLRNDIPREQFASDIEAQQGMSLDAFLKERAADPDFRRSVLMTRLLEKTNGEELAVSDEAVKERYEAEKDRVWSKPAQVQASHILIKTSEADSPEDKAAARAKAEEILAEVKKPDSDFAELAKAHSACPSSAKGGDLGYFPREGKMVEPFAAAAFDLQVGETSGVVETQFGYHIIKVTDRKEANVVSLEDATPHLRDAMRREKLGAVQQKYMGELKEKAEIVYPNAPAEDASSEAPAEEKPAAESAEKVAPLKAEAKPAGEVKAEDK